MDTVTWFAALVMMATFLNKLGCTAWFSGVYKLALDSLV
jgi:DASS family divalent anion:Na+ symporter